MRIRKKYFKYAMEIHVQNLPTKEFFSGTMPGTLSVNRAQREAIQYRSKTWLLASEQSASYSGIF